LTGRESTVSKWLTAEEAAEYLGVSVKHVRRHAAALGAVKLGTGRNAPLRFKASLIDSRILRAYQLDPGENLAPPPIPRPPKMSPSRRTKGSPPRSHAKEDRDVG
jgi:excisionase family DNA binding protein